MVDHCLSSNTSGISGGGGPFPCRPRLDLRVWGVNGLTVLCRQVHPTRREKEAILTYLVRLLNPAPIISAVGDAKRRGIGNPRFD